MKNKTIFLLIICMAAVVNSFSQTQEITRDEYYSQFRAAVSKPYEVSKRTTTKEESYDNQGKLKYERETINEYLQPDKQRYVEIYKSPKENRREEVIKIGETHYCRENNSEWRQSENWCGGPGIRVLPTAITSKITVENVKLDNNSATLYHQYITYQNKYAADPADKEKVYYLDNQFWVNSDGYVIRREMKDGLLEGNKISYKEISIYDYNPKNIKIEAPIK